MRTREEKLKQMRQYSRKDRAKAVAYNDWQHKATAQRFAVALLRPGTTAKGAYMAVFPDASPKTAESKVVGFMRRPVVQAALKRQTKLVEQGMEVREEWAVGLLKGMVETDVLDFLDDDGKIKNINELRELPREARLAIHGLTVKSNAVGGQDVAVKLHDKIRALEQIAKLKKWIEPGPTVTVNIGEQLQQAEQRLLQREAIEGRARAVDPSREPAKPESRPRQ